MLSLKRITLRSYVVETDYLKNTTSDKILFKSYCRINFLNVLELFKNKIKPKNGNEKWTVQLNHSVSVYLLL